jgi:hypothetical protein
MKINCLLLREKVLRIMKERKKKRKKKQQGYLYLFLKERKKKGKEVRQGKSSREKNKK